MVNEKSYILGSQRSGIRELFEYGRKRAAEVGRERVYDFSLGNPSVPAPSAVKNAVVDIFENTSPMAIHGYTSAAGSDEARGAVAASLTRRFGLAVRADNVYISCGAAAALTSVLGALTLDSSSEFIAIAPFFPEYRCFAEVKGGRLKVAEADYKDFQINFTKLEAAINANTQAIIINSPNNPSGAVYTEKTIKKLAKLLTEKSAELGRPIYIVSDEPYRELVYGGVTVPFIPNYYDNTIVTYSFSKTLSMPGERIGYVVVNDRVADSKRVFDAVAGTAREFGYVCAPSLMQKVIVRCIDVAPDLAPYERNRALLYGSLTEMGYECVKPDGAFYLLIKSPHGSGAEFSETAKRKDLLIVPCAAFGCPDYLRIAYCVDTDMIERSLPVFKSLI